MIAMRIYGTAPCASCTIEPRYRYKKAAAENRSRKVGKAIRSQVAVRQSQLGQAQVTVARHTCQPRLDQDPLDLIQADCIIGAVIELRRTRRLVIRDLLRMLDCTTVLQIGGDENRAEVAAARVTPLIFPRFEYCLKGWLMLGSFACFVARISGAGQVDDMLVA